MKTAILNSLFYFSVITLIGGVLMGLGGWPTNTGEWIALIVLTIFMYGLWAAVAISEIVDAKNKQNDDWPRYGKIR